MPVLTVNSQPKNKEQMDSKARLRRIFCEKFKDRKDINSVLRIVEEIPAGECKILKNPSFKTENEINRKIELRTRYKNNFKNLCSRSFMKLREESTYNRNEDETYFNKLK